MMAAASADDSGSLGASAAPAAPAADAPVSSGGGVATPTAPLQDDADDDADDDDDDELPLTLDKALEEGVNRAMRGDTGVLRQVLAPGVEWRGPLGNNVGIAKVEGELRGLGNLLSEPRMTVTASLDGALRLEWIASGTWRLPWLPRFIVRGASTVETGADGKVGVCLPGVCLCVCVVLERCVVTRCLVSHLGDVCYCVFLCVRIRSRDGRAGMWLQCACCHGRRGPLS